MKSLVIPVLIMMVTGFRDQQMMYPRVRDAYALKEEQVWSLLHAQGIERGPFHLFLRAFKDEQTLEVWATEKVDSPYALILTLHFCQTSGKLGPKRKEGDLQIPEGVYFIDRFNPKSNFHLALGLNYPNRSDRVLGDPQQPGSDIFIHGDCVTTGCIPLTDDKIRLLYVMAVEARESGQEHIPVHIFPARLAPGVPEKLSMGNLKRHLAFWKGLQPVYEHFETKRIPPVVLITASGAYEKN